MIEELLPSKPFFERYEFKGNLWKNNEVADNLQIIIQYSQINEGEIDGKVLGSQETFKRLERLFTLPGYLFRLASKKHEGITTEIFSDNVLIPTISNKNWPDSYAERMMSVVADLHFQDLTIIQHASLSESIDRHLTFFLAGPQTSWSISQMRELSLTGEMKTEVVNSKIELSESFPFEIEVVPRYFYGKATTPENTELSTYILALHLKTDKSVKELSNEDFVSLGRALADDLTLLISFLSKRWVTWFRYELGTSDGIKSYVRRTRECSTKEINSEDCLLELANTREFLKIGLTNFRRLRAENFDLFMPIVYFVSGSEKKYLEEQFTTYFLSLERLKDIFARKKELQHNLLDKTFKNLKSLVSKVIKESIQTDDVLERIMEKISELNRPSLSFLLNSLFSTYDVDWKDIYPQGSKFTLIRTRNKLFHSSEELNIDLLVKEVRRLQTILERLLLRMLGWEDLSCSPRDFMKRWLIAQENSKNNA